VAAPVVTGSCQKFKDHPALTWPSSSSSTVSTMYKDQVPTGSSPLWKYEQHKIIQESYLKADNAAK
jgi:hypothetical protein